MARNEDISVKEIFKSYDYEKFKFLECNRTVKKTFTLEKSIKEIDITDCCPIIVNKDFYIIDGQHRFTICKNLGRPIYYVVFNGDAELAMVNLNISVSLWRQEEWLEYYCGKSNPVYMALRDFMAKYPKLGISNAILIFSAERTNAKTFKAGRLVDNNPRKEEMANFIYNCNVPFAFYRPLVSAIVHFMESHSDNDIRKLQKGIICVPCFSKAESFLTAFENIISKRHK